MTTPFPLPDVDHIVVAGCWHANRHWATYVTGLLPRLLPDESPRLVVHSGDFGIWPGPHGNEYLDVLDEALTEADSRVVFVDGNHEHFPLLYRMAGTPTPAEPVALRDNIHWLPRGYRWTWHGRTWLALGGAVSVDRALRVEGKSWFPEEEITEAQSRRVAADGPADVMVCHDSPAQVRMSLPPPPRSWADRDLALAGRHRERLQAVVDEVRPSHLLHGHYHLSHHSVVEMAHGPVTVTGLDMDGVEPGNYRVLDVRTMSFVEDA